MNMLSGVDRGGEKSRFDGTLYVSPVERKDSGLLQIVKKSTGNNEGS